MSDRKQFSDLKVADLGKMVELEIQAGRYTGQLHSLEVGVEGGVLIELLKDRKFSYFLSGDLEWIEVKEES